MAELVKLHMEKKTWHQGEAFLSECLRLKLIIKSLCLALSRSRTETPCGGMNKGSLRTPIKAGEPLTVTWHLGYAHKGESGASTLR